MNGTASRLCPDTPAPVLDDLTEIRRPGGAALAALLAAREGARVVLIAPIGDDPPSAIVRALLQPHVTVVPLPLDGPLPDKARFRAGGQTLLRADGPAGRPGPASLEAAEAIASAGTLLVSDYGRGAASDPRLRAALAGRAGRVPLVWDPHPRGPEPVPGTRLATPNHAEARAAGLNPRPPGRLPAVQPHLRPGAPLRRRGRGPTAQPVAGGRRGRDPGPHGTLLTQGSPAPLIVPARPVHGADTCGAGDLFAAAAANALSHGALPSEAVVIGPRTASDLLAAGGVGSLVTGQPRPAAHRRPGRGHGPGGGPAGALTRPGRAGGPGSRGRRHGGGDRRLLRRAARRPRQPAPGGPLAGRLPDRVPQLRRVGPPPERRGPPAEPGRRPGLGAVRLALRGRRAGVRRGHPAAQPCNNCGPMSG